MPDPALSITKRYDIDTGSCSAERSLGRRQAIVDWAQVRRSRLLVDAAKDRNTRPLVPRQARDHVLALSENF